MQSIFGYGPDICGWICLQARFLRTHFVLIAPFVLAMIHTANNRCSLALSFTNVNIFFMDNI